MVRSLLLFAIGRLSTASFHCHPTIPFPTLRSFSAARTLHMSSKKGDKSIVVDDFCFRQFAEHEASKSYRGTVFTVPLATFEDIVNERYNQSLLRDGYAPFCKHIFLENDFTDAVTNVLPITPENEGLLRSKYEARNDKELPVLVRWFPVDLVDVANLPKAKYLDLILYSREQINQENASQSRHDAIPSTAPWGIVSIKAQDTDYELPMTPITAMRNALGKEEGGSGIPLDRKSYMESVNYWRDHATVS